MSQWDKILVDLIKRVIYRNAVGMTYITVAYLRHAKTPVFLVFLPIFYPDGVFLNLVGFHFKTVL